MPPIVQNAVIGNETGIENLCRYSRRLVIEAVGQGKDEVPCPEGAISNDLSVEYRGDDGLYLCDPDPDEESALLGL